MGRMDRELPKILVEMPTSRNIHVRLLFRKVYCDQCLTAQRQRRMSQCFPLHIVDFLMKSNIRPIVMND